MATKGLTPVARRASGDHLPASDLVRQEPDLRGLLIGEDAGAVWKSIHSIIRSLAPNSAEHLDHLTQEVFICLIATGRFDTYISEKYTSDEITSDLLSMLPDDFSKSGLGSFVAASEP